ncbi:MAG: hypothetical protein HY000_36310 [Planctomycetes bacterium]|nr:hypothetical protein [Planctomycetia bacterium]MBI3468498.1 hypothetical protein [Planctomycetota bacterium]
MFTRRWIGRTVVVMLAALSAAGCAPQYHWYSNPCCCIPYDYPPAAPLPYTTYCGCPTPVASCYEMRKEESMPRDAAAPPSSSYEPGRANP